MRHCCILAAFTLFLIGLSANAASAQKHKEWYHEATVTLRDGSVLRGKLLEDTEDRIRLQILGGSIFAYPKTEVLTVTVSDTRIYSILKTYRYGRDGWYYDLSAFANFSNDGDGGIGATFSAGYQLNNYLGLGLATGYNYLSANNGVQLFPFAAEVRGQVLQAPVTPFYRVTAGYSFATRNPDFGIIEARGGWFWYPAIGMRWDTYSGSAFTLDGGYQFQSATIVSQSWNGTNTDDLTFRRFTLRAGFVF